MRRPNFGRFQKKPSAGASNNGRIDGANVCVCVCARARARAGAQGSYFEGDYTSVVICPIITVLYYNSGNFLTGPRMLVPVACPPVTNVSIFSHKRHDFRKKLLNINCVFWISLQLVSETVCILRRNARDIVINVHRSSSETPVILVRLK